MQKANLIEVFFELLRAGLWEQKVQYDTFYDTDFGALYQLAEEQSVIGLIAAGLEQVEDVSITKQQTLPFVKRVLLLESCNSAMNRFIETIITKLQEKDIYVLLVKGQGIAQCYSRPLWRTLGDVDLYLDSSNYEKAKDIFLPLAVSYEEENVKDKHLGMTIDSWVVELHGTLHCSLSPRIDKVIDKVQKQTFMDRGVRVWKNGSTNVLLPSPDNDIVFVFTHILKHFFKGGIGLRQICDWCRLLYQYRNTIDIILLKDRVNAMGIMSEWKAFAAYSVDYLGMRAENVPMYSTSKQWSRKAKRINSFILEVGNFGHNRDISYYDKNSFIIRKTISLWRRTTDFFRYLFIFPQDSLFFYSRTLVDGFLAVAKGR